MGEKEGEWEWEGEELSNIETRSESWKVCVRARKSFPVSVRFQRRFH